MSRVLVTGATGFIGRHTLRPLLEAGHEVHAVARRPPSVDEPAVRWHVADLLDEAQSRAIVSAVGASHLLHLAWYVEHGRFWDAHENADWVAATVRLARLFAEAGGQRAVLAGTCAEYDWATVDGRCSEADTPLRPVTFYGLCKDATRRVVERLGIETAWGRIFFLYGPGEHPGRLVAGVSRSLVAGERVATSEGTQLRDFLYVSDVAGAFAALTSSAATGAVNIGSGEAVPVGRVVELIAAAAGRPDLLDVGALARRPHDPEQLVADATRLREEVGWRPSVALEDGIAQTVAWWHEHEQARASAPQG